LIAQIDLFEPFNDCAENTWAIVQEDPNQSSWNCTTEFGQNAIRLRGNRSDFDIWLVSQEVDLSSSTLPYFTFRYKNKIVNGDLELLYAVDFSGNVDYQEVINTEWKSIPIDIYPIGDDSEINNFIFHPTIDLSMIEGESIHFAFRFFNQVDDFDILLDDIEIGSDYYTEIESDIDNGLRCGDLKTGLSQLISNHRPIAYTSFAFDVWDSHFTTDLRLNDAGERQIIWDMYSDIPDGNEPYEYTPGEDRDFGQDITSEGLFYNREHSFPTSWWGGDQETTQFSDIHFVIPVDKVVNSIRLNFPYGETSNPTLVTANGSQMGRSSVTGFDGDIFEPIDEYKGDIARMHLYVATRYEEFAEQWATVNSRGRVVFVGQAFPFFEDWYINLLVRWHEMDPVSQKELDRNDAVFAIQGNRNPFIDHPEYVGFVWGSADGIACDRITSVNDQFESSTLVIYPNPAQSIITIETEETIDRIQFFDADGKLHFTKNAKNTHDISDLRSGVYFLKIWYQDGSLEASSFIKI